MSHLSRVLEGPGPGLVLCETVSVWQESSGPGSEGLSSLWSAGAAPFYLFSFFLSAHMNYFSYDNTEHCFLLHDKHEAIGAKRCNFKALSYFYGNPMAGRMTLDHCSTSCEQKEDR